ncbi:trna pseudouridine synthase [Stylonychia lemnae]|uniref:Trna pseudouridine synthase n=1 Tax=Stylonychia lemnae TaxID=5949 RepID=A0A078B3D4_STYLE|nr:trna pseudouridine synthase [Stylonychia lemnae]|eukprot:CDW87747.1 trna pseudouridine synthase [Stylonychia lemnae]
MESTTQIQADEKNQQMVDFGESEAGIQEFMSAENTQIPCVIKHRFSDFIVNEIDEFGNVVWFTPETDLQKWRKGAPTNADGEVTVSAEEQKQMEIEQEQQELVFPDEKLEKLKILIPESDYIRFIDYLQRIREGSYERTEIFVFENSIEDKAKRSAVHQFFKNEATVFETDTDMSQKDVRLIRVFLKNAFSANKRRKMNIIDRKPQGSVEEWPQYLKVVVQKTNVDTMQAVHYIAKKLKKFGKSFQVAGNKDKRGITTQRITILRGNPEQVIRFQRSKDWDKKIKIGGFERVLKPIRLGQLSGNRFSVALRFIPDNLTDEQIAKRFLNYFGMQRFGTYNVRTHRIGIENLRQDWQKVCELILSQHPDGDEDSKFRKQKILKMVFEEKNIDSALNYLDRRDVIYLQQLFHQRLEKSILCALKKSPNVVGDLVVEPEKSKAIDEADNGDDALIDQVEVDEDEDNRLELPHFDKLDKEENKKNKDQKPKLHGAALLETLLIDVTEENIHKYKITDVVMPLIGHMTRFPENKELIQIMYDLMSKDNITLNDFERSAQLDGSSSNGSYRKIVAHASDLEYDVVKFQNTNEDLLTPNPNAEKDPAPELQADQLTHRALRIKMSLKQSSYATMMIREVTKVSSAFSVQNALSRDKNQA